MIHYKGAEFSRSLYFSIVTFTTVGYGDISPDDVNQTYLGILIGAAGSTYFAGIISNITSFVHSVNISEDNVAHKKAVVSVFSEERGLSRPLRDRITAFFAYLEDEKYGVDEMKLLDTYLPDHMRNDVVLFLTHRLILSCKVFRGLESGFLRSVMLRLVQNFYMKGENIIEFGQPVDGMFLVAAGQVEIYIGDEKVHELVQNQSFAEDAMLTVIDENEAASASVSWPAARSSTRGQHTGVGKH